MDLCHFFFILYHFPAPGSKEIGENQSSCFVLLCLHLVHSTFVFFSSFLCLQLEESFRRERFPSLCCEAVKPQGRCRFLWESSLWISRDAKAPNSISSARTLLADLLQGIPKEKGKKKSPKKDPRFWLSCWHLIAPVQRRIFVSCFCFSRGVQRPRTVLNFILPEVLLRRTAVAPCAADSGSQPGPGWCF